MKKTTFLPKVLIAIAAIFMWGFAQAGTALVGTYTINAGMPATSTNFTSFQMAVDSLTTNGVSGAVTINVTAGTYTEQITIAAITGGSALNDVTFQGVLGTPASVKLAYASTGFSTNWTLRFNGASYINFKDMTIEATGATYARVIFFDGGNDYITFMGNEFIGITTSTSSTNGSLIYNESGSTNLTNNCLFDGNTFTNGSYALYWWGGSTSTKEIGNQFMLNTISNYRVYGLYLYYQADALISENNLNASTAATSCFGIYHRGDSATITKNTIVTRGTSSQYGIYLYYTSGSAAAHTEVSNNMITTSPNATSTSYGIYSYNGNYIDLFHNSINVRGGSTTGSRALFLNRTTSTSTPYGNIDVRNNIFNNSDGNYALEVSPGIVANSAATLNNNNYYSPGTNPFKWNNSNYTTFAAYKTASSQDSNSVFGDPLFVSGEDLHIIGTLVNDAGDNTTGIVDDIDGDTRPFTGATIVDIGADEFAPPLCSQSSALVVNTLTSSTANVGWTSTSGATAWNIEYGAPGFSPGSGTIVAASSNPFTITGLTAQTTYDFYVQDNCGANGNSLWAGPVSFTTFCATQLNGTYTLDTNSATAGTNFKSFTDFFTELDLCGVSGPVTLNVKEGTYTGQLTFKSFVGGSSTNMVTVQSNPTNTNPVVITYSPAGFSDNWTLYLDAASHWKFTDLTLASGGTSYSRVVIIAGTSANLMFTDNIFNGVSNGTFGSTNNAVFYYGSFMVVDGLTIKDNTFNNGSYCTYLNGSSGNLSDNLLIEGNTTTGTLSGGFRGGYWKNITVIGNDITAATNSTSQYGVYFYGSGSSPNTRAIIKENVIKLNTTSTVYGIYLNYYNALTTAPSEIINNMVSNSTTTGTGTRYGLNIYHVANMNIYHNSISILDGSSSSGRAMYFSKSTSTSYFATGGVNVVNNIVSNTGNGYGMYVWSTATTNVFNRIDYNVYNTTGTNPFYWGTNQANLAAWTTASTMDSNGIAGDPIFTNASDLHLIGSVANDVGDNSVNVIVDIDGDTRPLAPSTIVDIGADEYAASSCAPPTGITVLSVTNNSAIIYWTTGGASDWMLQYDTSGFTLGAGTQVAATNDTMTITGLTAATSYDVYVKDSCSLTSTSPWAGPATFFTSCDPVSTFPYIEGFEGSTWTASSGTSGDAIDPCWDRTPTSYPPFAWLCHTGGTGSGGTGPSGANNGSNYMYTESSSGVTGTFAELVMPTFNVSALANPELSFFYHFYGSNIDRMFIEISTDGGAVWTKIDSIVGQGQSANADPFLKKVVGLGAYKALPILIKFNGVKGSSFACDYAIDDITISSVSCPQPSAPMMMAATTTTIDFYFTSGGSANANIEYDTVGFTPGTGNFMAVTNDTVQLTGLTAGTQYDIYVRDSCGTGDVSLWSGPLTASTLLCDTSSACTYTVYMHDTYGDGWNGNLIAVHQSGVGVATFTMPTASGTAYKEDTAYISLCDMDTATVILEILGNFTSEVGFEIVSPMGDTLLTRNSGSSFFAGHNFGSFFAECPNACAINTFPYMEDFEGSTWVATAGTSGDTIDGCWDRTPTSYPPFAWLAHTGGTGSSGTGPSGAHSGSNYMFTESSSGTTGALAELVMPPFNMTALTNPELSFFYHFFGSNIDRMYVEISTDGGTIWTKIDSIVGQGQVGNTDPYMKKIVNLSAYKALPMMIKFNAKRGSSFASDYAIDDVVIADISCPQPGIPMLLNATTTSIEFYYTSGGSANANVEYDTVGFIPGTGNFMAVTNDTVLISGLTAGTQYDIYVRDSCGTGDVSFWSGPLATNTLVCDTSSTCTYTIFMDDSFGDGWNGNVVAIKQKGVTIGTFGTTFTGGSADTAYINLCDLDTASVELDVLGSFTSEVGFSIVSPQGVTMLTRASGSTFPAGFVFGSFYAQCAVPSCPISDTVTVADETSCGPNSVTFMASGNVNPNAEYIWMRNDSAVVGTGANYTTLPITATTNYFVGLFATDDSKAQQHVGALPNIAASGYGNFSNGQWFHADDYFFLDSITVNQDMNTVNFQVRISEPGPAGAGAEIQRSDVITTIGTGDHKVYVGLYISPGSYFINLDFVTGTTGQLFRATGGAVYPYAINNLVSIDSVNFGTPRYYYTFDWVVSEVCHGPLATAQAIKGVEPSTALPYMETFNTGLACNWTTDALTTGADWMDVTSYGTGNSLDSTAFMMIDDDAPGSSAATEASLISPAFDIQGYDSLKIEFDHYFRGLSGTSDSGFVEVWDGSMWQVVYSTTASSGAWFAPDHQSIDVTMYKNTAFQVRFRYKDGGQWAWYWSVDNFALDGIVIPCENVVVDILTDNFGSETTWSIEDTATGTVFASGGPYPDALITHYIDTICIPTGVFYEFRINDSWGDGLFDGTNTGTYDVDIICSWGTNNVISGSGAYPYGGATPLPDPSWDSIVFEVTCVQPACLDPVLVMDSVMCDTAWIAWTSDTSATSRIEYGATGFTPGMGNGTTVNNVTSMYQLTGLMHGTSYDYYILDSCSNGNLSMWIGPGSFTTDPLPIASFINSMIPPSGRLDTVAWGFNSAPSQFEDYSVWDYGDGSPLDTGNLKTHDYLTNGTYDVILTVYNDCGSDSDTQQVIINTIGILEMSMNQISVYPNPSTGKVLITDINSALGETELNVLNSLGQKVWSEDLYSGQTKVELDLSDLQDGMYHIQLITQAGIISKPLVIQH